MREDIDEKWINSLLTIRLWTRQEPMILFLHARDHKASHLNYSGSFCGLARCDLPRHLYKVWLGSFVQWLGFFVMWLGRRLSSGNYVACQPLFGPAMVFRHTIGKDLTGTNSPLGQGKPLVVAWLILWLAWGGVNWHSVEVRQSNSSCYKERLYWVNTPLARGRSLKV